MEALPRTIFADIYWFILSLLFMQKCLFLVSLPVINLLFIRLKLINFIRPCMNVYSNLLVYCNNCTISFTNKSYWNTLSFGMTADVNPTIFVIHFVAIL